MPVGHELPIDNYRLRYKSGFFVRWDVQVGQQVMNAGVLGRLPCGIGVHVARENLSGRSAGTTSVGHRPKWVKRC